MPVLAAPLVTAAAASSATPLAPLVPALAISSKACIQREFAGFAAASAASAINFLPASVAALLAMLPLTSLSAIPTAPTPAAPTPAAGSKPIGVSPPGPGEPPGIPPVPAGDPACPGIPNGPPALPAFARTVAVVAPLARALKLIRLPKALLRALRGPSIKSSPTSTAVNCPYTLAAEFRSLNVLARPSAISFTLPNSSPIPLSSTSPMAVSVFSCAAAPTSETFVCSRAAPIRLPTCSDGRVSPLRYFLAFSMFFPKPRDSAIACFCRLSPRSSKVPIVDLKLSTIICLLCASSAIINVLELRPSPNCALSFPAFVIASS